MRKILIVLGICIIILLLVSCTKTPRNIPNNVLHDKIMSIEIDSKPIKQLGYDPSTGSRCYDTKCGELHLKGIVLWAWKGKDNMFEGMKCDGVISVMFKHSIYPNYEFPACPQGIDCYYDQGYEIHEIKDEYGSYWWFCDPLDEGYMVQIYNEEYFNAYMETSE